MIGSLVNGLRSRAINSVSKMFPHITWLDASTAQQLDKDLMGADVGYSEDQLMELAGLSVAQAVADCFPVQRKVLIIVGPGNNGGDGLVAARHLHHFGWQPTVLYPKQPDKLLYKRLVRQLNHHEVPVVTEAPDMGSFELLVDAIFGFSFVGVPRSPFADIINKMISSRIPIVSVDVPSGWDVDKGAGESRLMPDCVVSLTLPKQSLRGYKGLHYVGGRFVPSSLEAKYKLTLPPFAGSDQIVKLQLS
eukprot:GHVS01027178.1.p1 GENE.GHVS01027178.1~~GHVS01027178.1.p1  ORF type:complete len:248 (-),score=33.53 GHVS01027178.1:180-923(-)